MERFIGTWRLVEWMATVDGSPQRPFGGKPTGILIYTRDGWMSAALMRADRPDLPASTLGSATARDRARAATGYLHYAGRFRVEGPTVIHTVEVSLFPNWVGSEQVRTVTWEPNEDGSHDLVLAAESHPAGRKPVMNRLRWRRVSDPALG